MNLRVKIRNFLLGFISFTFLWYIASKIVNSGALPSPFIVFEHFPDVFEDEIFLHISASLKRLAIALLISSVTGFIIGFLMGRFKKVNALLNPLVYFTYPIPKTALLPVIMILYGLGDMSKVILIVVITVFQFIVAIRDAVSQVDKALYMPLKSLGASEFQMFTHVTFFAILPSLLTNFRLQIGTSLSILFFAENYGTHYGLGYYIQDAWNRIDYLSMYSGILILSFIGFILFITIDVLEELFCKWQNID